jgi:hypothetical protein
MDFLCDLKMAFLGPSRLAAIMADATMHNVAIQQQLELQQANSQRTLSRLKNLFLLYFNYI